MASNTISIIIEAKDRASGVLGRVAGSTSRLRSELNLVAAAGLRAVGGALTHSVTRATEFEAQMARVGAVAGASDEVLAQLQATALQLGSTTKFTATEAAEGMQFLAMAGFEAKDIISAMPGVLATAAAGNVDLGRAADISSNILSGFNLEASESGRIADVLTATFTNSNTSMETLGQSFKFVGPVAANMNQSLESTAAAIGILGNAGIQGTMAGRGLRTILTSLAAPTSAASKLMSEMGIVTQDATTGQFLPLNNILGQLSAGMTGYSDAQRTAALKTLVGKNALSQMMVLMDSAGSGQLANFTSQLNAAGGTAETVANQQLQSLAGQMTMLTSALDGVAIGVGSALLPMLTALVSNITGLVQSHGPRLVEIFSNFSTKINEVGGQALPVINDALSRMGQALGLSSGDVSSADVVLGALEKTLDGVVIGVKAFAIGMNRTAEAIETVVGLASQVKEMIGLMGQLSAAQNISGVTAGIQSAGSSETGIAGFGGAAASLLTGGLFGGIQAASNVILQIDGQKVGSITGGHQGHAVKQNAAAGGSAFQ